MASIAAQMGHDSLCACAFAHSGGDDEIWLRIF
jgi:hypothetical protein